MEILRFFLYYMVCRFIYDNFRRILNRVLWLFNLHLMFNCDGHIWLFKGNDFNKPLFIVWPKWLRI